MVKHLRLPRRSSLTYGLLGGIAGSLGVGIQGTGTLLGMQRFAAQLSGGSLLVIGLLGIARLASGTGHTPWLPKKLQHFLAQGHAWARKQKPLPRALVVGVLTAILPCGWLYAFLLVAAGTASPWSGAMVMATFAIGSIPALVAVVLGTSSLFGRFHRIAPWCSAILVTVVGSYTLLHRAQVDLSRLPSPKKSSVYSLVRSVQAIDQEELPCCEEDSLSNPEKNKE